MQVGGDEDSGPSAMSCAVLLIGPNLRGGSLGGQLGGLLPINAVRLSLGVLLDVQKYFHISDSHAGLLQTGKEPVLDPGTKAFFVLVWWVLWPAPDP